jgi:hypothetical protein
MSLKMYGLDRYAHDLVAEFCPKGVLNETHNMRTTAALGLERFFGEHLRLSEKEEGKYWRKTWDVLVKIMAVAGISVPTLKGIENIDSKAIKTVIDDLWNEDIFSKNDRKITLAVLIQLCDNMVWWAQRYKKFSPKKSDTSVQKEEENMVVEEANNAGA